MAVKTETKTINGRNFFVVQMAPERAIPIQLRMTRILGGAIAQLAPVLSTKGDMDNGARTAAMAGAISALFATSTEEEVYNLIATVVTTAKCDGKSIDINMHFQGEYLADIYKVFFWVLGVNFSSFFGAGGLDGLMDKFRLLTLNALASQAPQPQASTPTSGDQSQPDSAN